MTGMARSLLIADTSFIARGCPVYGVTSDTANSVSFQTAAPKPAWPDPSQQANDSFGALVDSNIQAAAANDPSPAPQQPTPAPQQPPPAPQPSGSDAQAAPDNSASRNT